MPLGQSQDISQVDPGGRVSPRFWHRLIRFRQFIGGSLALASLNLACRDHVPTFPQRSPPSLLTTAAWRFRDPFAADRVGGGSWDSAAAVPGAGPAMAAGAGTIPLGRQSDRSAARTDGGDSAPPSAPRTGCAFHRQAGSAANRLRQWRSLAGMIGGGTRRREPPCPA